MQLKVARLIFYSAALFNWGAVLLFLPALGIARHLGIDPAPAGTIFEDIGLAAVIVFGAGYWMVGNAPERHRGIIHIGLIGKLMVVAIVCAHYLAGSASLALAAVVSGDLIYAALFILFLKSTPRPESSARTS